MMDQNEKLELMRNAILKLSNEVVEGTYVTDAMQEFAQNMHFENTGLPRFGLRKIANYAAQVAIAKAILGGTDILMYSWQGSAEEIDKAYETMANANLVPTEV